MGNKTPSSCSSLSYWSTPLQERPNFEELLGGIVKQFTSMDNKPGFWFFTWFYEHHLILKDIWHMMCTSNWCIIIAVYNKSNNLAMVSWRVSERQIVPKYSLLNTQARFFSTPCSGSKSLFPFLRNRKTFLQSNPLCFIRYQTRKIPRTVIVNGIVSASQNHHKPIVSTEPWTAVRMPQLRRDYAPLALRTNLYWTKILGRLTDVNAPGKNIIVKIAIPFMDELSWIKIEISCWVTRL